MTIVIEGDDDMEIEFDILDLLQKLHTPIGDQVMCTITKLGNAGAIWIMLTLILLLIPKTRRCGEHGHSASDSQTVRLVVSVRTYIRCVCIGIRTVFSCIQQYWCCGIGEPDGSKEGLEACVATGVSDCVFQAVSVCALSD